MRDATKRFIAANKESPVVIGTAKDKGGARYKLANGQWFNLGLATCREMPAGYPRWAL
jgi:hypothetical protein